jgi:hypothetical protein
MHTRLKFIAAVFTSWITLTSSAIAAPAVGQSLAYELGASWRGPAPSTAAMRSTLIVVQGKALRADAKALRLPLFDREVVVMRTHAQEHENGSLSWSGHIDGDPEQQLSLTFDGEHLAGYISATDGVYELTPTPSGNVLMQIDTKLFPPCGGSVRSPAHDFRRAQSTGAPTVAPRGSTSTMDVLVVFSPESLAQLGSQAAAQTFAQQAVDSTNLAYTNSQMTARMRLVGVRFTTRAGSGSGETDLDWLSANAEVAAWRNEVGADGVRVDVAAPDSRDRQCR